MSLASIIIVIIIRFVTISHSLIYEEACISLFEVARNIL